MGKVSDHTPLPLYDIMHAAAAMGEFKLSVNGQDYKIDFAALMMGLTGHIDPHHPMFAGGAKGDCIATNDAIVASGNQLTLPNHVPNGYYVGKYVSINGVGRTIASINGGAYVLSSSVSNGTGLPILMGTDDTAAINAALAYASGVRAGYGDGGGADPGANMISIGGSVKLRPTSYLISNTQAEYTGGKLSAVVIPRRVALIGSGIHQTQLHMKAGSYGHCVAPKLIGASAWMDFMEVGCFTVFAYRGWNPNVLNTFHFHVAFDGYAGVDPRNRIHDLHADQSKGADFYFSGRGEAVIDNCHGFNGDSYGFEVRGFMDSVFSNCNAGGKEKTAFRIYASGAVRFNSCKGFYSGKGGGSNAADCAGVHLDGDTLFAGQVNLTDFEVQETRGSSFLINSASNTFIGCRALDPGRSGIAAGTLPGTVAGFDLSGANCVQNIFAGCKVSPSVPLYQSDNWGNAGHSVAIDGSAEKNQGDIWTWKASTSDSGTDYDGGFGAKGGAGTSNGKNTMLKVDGVACT